MIEKLKQQLATLETENEQAWGKLMLHKEAIRPLIDEQQRLTSEWCRINDKVRGLKAVIDSMEVKTNA